MYLIACIVHVLCMYFDVSRSIKIHQDSTSRYIKIHLYLALQSSEHLYLTNSLWMHLRYMYLIFVSCMYPACILITLAEASKIYMYLLSDIVICIPNVSLIPLGYV